MMISLPPLLTCLDLLVELALEGVWQQRDWSTEVLLSFSQYLYPHIRSQSNIIY